MVEDIKHQLKGLITNNYKNIFKVNFRSIIAVATPAVRQQKIRQIASVNI